MSLETETHLESEYVMGTFARKPVEFVEGAGMYLRDDAGRDYLDFLSGIAVCSLGHCHPALVAALQEQAAKLMHVSNYFYIERRGELARRLSDLLSRGEGDGAQPWRTFFANSGAEANECAIKLARLYARKRAAADALAVGADEQGVAEAEAAAPRLIVTLQRSFHGRTLATLAATAQPAKQEAFQPLPEGFAATPINDCEALRCLFDERGPEICAVLVEPVQGESGVHPCTPEFMAQIRELTSRCGALFMCDEVQTGIFRCGEAFAFQRLGVVPDVVTMAKGIGGGMPMGACAARDSVAAAFAPGDHGTTFGGSCLAVAAAHCVLDVVEEESLAQRVVETGDYLRRCLAELPAVAEVRGLGLLVGADLTAGLSAPAVVAAALESGLVLNATGPSTLRFVPPLICTREDVDAMMGILVRCIDAA